MAYSNCVVCLKLQELHPSHCLKSKPDQPLGVTFRTETSVGGWVQAKDQRRKEFTIKTTTDIAVPK